MNKSSYYVAIVCLGWVVIALSRMLIVPFLPVIEDEFHVSHAQAALLMSSYMLPYAVMQLPAGLFSDRFGSKFLMILAMLGVSIGNFLINFALSFNQILVIRFFAGAFAGLWFTPSSKIVIEHTNSRRLGSTLGWGYAGASFGGVLTYILAGISSSIGMAWRSLFTISSIPSLLCMIFICIFVKDAKKEEGNLNKDSMDKRVSRVMLLKHFKICSPAFVSYFLASLASWSLNTFTQTYLVISRGLSVAEASTIMSLQTTSSVFSQLLVGIIIDRIGFKKPLIASWIVMCSVSFLIPISPLLAPMCILLLLWGLTQGWPFTALNIFIINNSPSTLRGTFLGILNQLGFISATIGPPFFGFIIDILGFESSFILSSSLFLTSLVIALSITGRDERLP